MLLKELLKYPKIDTPNIIANFFEDINRWHRIFSKSIHIKQFRFPKNIRYSIESLEVISN